MAEHDPQLDHPDWTWTAFGSAVPLCVQAGPGGTGPNLVLLVDDGQDRPLAFFCDPPARVSAAQERLWLGHRIGELLPRLELEHLRRLRLAAEGWAVGFDATRGKGGA